MTRAYHHRRIAATVAVTAASLLAAAGVSACGGGGPARSRHTRTVTDTVAATGPHHHARRARRTPAPSNADIGSAAPQTTTTRSHRRERETAGAHAQGRARGHRSAPHAVRTRRDPVVRLRRIERARATPAAAADDQTSTPNPTINPCHLVTAGEARSITSGRVQGALEAPLGPTCVYSPRPPQTTEITLAVESLKLPAAAKHARTTVAGHPGYCPHLGTQMLFVPLGDGQMLNIVAPCPVAKRFAALALHRLT